MTIIFKLIKKTTLFVFKVLFFFFFNDNINLKLIQFHTPKQNILLESFMKTNSENSLKVN